MTPPNRCAVIELVRLSAWLQETVVVRLSSWPNRIRVVSWLANKPSNDEYQRADINYTMSRGRMRRLAIIPDPSITSTSRTLVLRPLFLFLIHPPRFASKTAELRKMMMILALRSSPPPHLPPRTPPIMVIEPFPLSIMLLSSSFVRVVRS